MICWLKPELRCRIAPRPAEALASQAKGVLLVGIRGDDQRRAGGLIPGAPVLPRNSLEWRCDPTAPWRHPIMNDRPRPLILICNDGFPSGPAAASLHRLGLVNATDLDGGFMARSPAVTGQCWLQARGEQPKRRAGARSVAQVRG
jgi:rhodanese-related sulfurtransferase